jgi:hypothetical protein
MSNTVKVERNSVLIDREFESFTYFLRDNRLKLADIDRECSITRVVELQGVISCEFHSVCGLAGINQDGQVLVLSNKVNHLILAVLHRNKHSAAIDRSIVIADLGSDRRQLRWSRDNNILGDIRTLFGHSAALETEIEMMIGVDCNRDFFENCIVHVVHE